MEVQQKSFFEAHLATSKFVQKVIELPMIKAAVDTAGGAYTKVKDSNALVGKSLELAVNISYAVAGKLSPLAEKGISVCAPISTKVDDIAAKSLDGLIERVPVIKEEPTEIVHNTRTAIEKQVTVLNGYTEVVLKTWVAQSAMDVYEVMLNTACNTLETCLPSNKEESSGSEQNGLASKTDYPSEEEKHKRGIWLAQRTYLMFSTAFRRVFGVCQTQVENATNATDIVYKQVKNAMGDVPNANNESEASNATNNGDSAKSNKKKGKKNNPQE